MVETKRTETYIEASDMYHVTVENLQEHVDDNDNNTIKQFILTC
jgi:hypothetical protein